MANFTYKTFVKGKALSTTTASYYVASTTAIVHKVTFTNTDTSPRTVTLYYVPSAGTAGASNIIVSGATIFPNESWSPPDAVGHTLETGASIQAKISSGTAVNMYVSGVEVS